LVKSSEEGPDTAPVSSTTTTTGARLLNQHSGASRCCFQVALDIIDGEIGFSPPLTELIAAAPLAVGGLLSQLDRFPQLENLVMKHLFWAEQRDVNQKFLLPLSEADPDVAALQAALRVVIAEALRPAYAYLQNLQIRLAPGGLNPQAHACGGVVWENMSLEACRAEVEAPLRQRETVLRMIPPHVWLGVVVVDCRPAREKLAHSLLQLYEERVHSFVRNLRLRCTDLNAAYRALQLPLEQTPTEPRHFRSISTFVKHIIALCKAFCRTSISSLTDPCSP